MKKTLLAVSLITILAIAVSFSLAPRISAQSNAPFAPAQGVTFIKEHWNMEKGGADTLMAKTLYAMRSDGAYVEGSKSPSATAYDGTWPIRNVTFPHDNKTVNVMDYSGTKTTLEFSPTVAASFVTAGRSRLANSCMAFVPQQEKYVVGNELTTIGPFRAYRIEVKDPLSHLIIYRSPDYNCLEVESVQEFLELGNVVRTARTHVDPSSVKYGEPDPALFAVSDQLAEVSPSKATIIAETKLHGSVDKAPSCVLARLNNADAVKKQDHLYNSFGPTKSLLSRAWARMTVKP